MQGVSGVWQLSSATCPAAFTNSTTARQLLPTTQGSGGVKSLYLPTPGTFYFTSPVGSNCASGAMQLPLYISRYVKSHHFLYRVV